MVRICAAATCMNNSKYRDRYIIMPHVIELQFHMPKPEDYEKWKNKLNRKGYRVTQHTRVCSNHFKYGKPLAGTSVPTLYMHSYPNWAVSRKLAIKEVAALEDGLICHALAHICKYLDPITSARLASQYGAPPGNHDRLTETLQKLPSCKARQLVNEIAPIVPGGKCLGALHIYRYGALLEHYGGSVKRSSKHRPDSKVGSCYPYSIQDFHPYAKTAACGQTIDLDETPCKKHKCCECSKEDSTLMEMQHAEVDLNNQMIELKGEMKHMKEILNGPVVSIEKIKNSDELIQLHTGLPSYQYFKWVYNEVDEASENMTYWYGGRSENAKQYQKANQNKPGPARVLSKENELLLTLTKLRLNMMEEYLAYLFGITQSTVSSIISTWIPLLSLELSGLIYWPEVEEIKLCYPHCFKRWPGIRAILDCFEIPTQKPSHVEANTQIFSSYKNRTTTKFLLACTPGGSISYISPPAGGNMSDKELVISCNIPQKFSPGDKCMVDKGFNITGKLLEHGVEIVHPPFVHKGQPFTEEKNRLSKQIAHARIHVERVIGRLRDYKYMSSEIPVSQLDLIGPAATVCCALTNLKNSVVTNS